MLFADVEDLHSRIPRTKPVIAPITVTGASDARVMMAPDIVPSPTDIRIVERPPLSPMGRLLIQYSMMTE